MEKVSPIELDFEEYIRHTEADKKEKTYAWSTAIGLQKVDGLTPSKYLFETAKRNIEGDISIEEASKLIDTYYESKTERTESDDERVEEADKVSSRIAQILSEKSFTFSPSFLISIHKRLFEGIFTFAGKIRDYDISKNEWVLNGDTVMYGAAFELKAALDYDFEQERSFNYKNLSMEQIVKHITFFVSRLWQIHAFGEGNTRTTAVFTIKYLRSLGFSADNDIFTENSWYFRNALVRANYTNLQKDIAENPEYLEKFFRNLLMGEHNELKNRYMHVNYRKQVEKSSEEKPESSEEIVKSSEQKQKSSDKILEILKANPDITAKEIAERIAISPRAVEKQIAALKQKGLVEHTGSTKSGTWIVKDKGENDK